MVINTLGKMENHDFCCTQHDDYITDTKIFICSGPSPVFMCKKRGFAKSRPVAHGPRRPSGPAARRPIGPRPTARDGPAARWPSPDFPQSFCPAVNPRTCTDLHRVWACKMDDGEFEFVYHFNNHFNPIRPFLSLHVAK